MSFEEFFFGIHTSIDKTSKSNRKCGLDQIAVDGGSLCAVTRRAGPTPRLTSLDTHYPALVPISPNTPLNFFPIKYLFQRTTEANILLKEMVSFSGSLK